DRLLLGLFDEAAGVDDDGVGVVDRGGQLVAGLAQLTQHDLAVDAVLGAAEADHAHSGAGGGRKHGSSGGGRGEGPSNGRTSLPGCYGAPLRIITSQPLLAPREITMRIVLASIAFLLASTTLAAEAQQPAPRETGARADRNTTGRGQVPRRLDWWNDEGVAAA